MKLKSATLVAGIAILVLFLGKTLATVFPGWFERLSVARVAVTVSTLATLTVVYFYYLFYRDYARRDQPRLRQAALLAAIGAGAVALLHIKGFLLVYDLYVTRFLVQSHLAEALIPWGASIVTLIFFIAFMNAMTGIDKPRLNTALRLAVIGSTVGIVERTIVLYHYLKVRDAPYAAGLPDAIRVTAFPFILFAVGATLYFFFVFYREQESPAVPAVDTAD